MEEIRTVRREISKEWQVPEKKGISIHRKGLSLAVKDLERHGRKARTVKCDTFRIRQVRVYVHG